MSIKRILSDPILDSGCLKVVERGNEGESDCGTHGGTPAEFTLSENLGPSLQGLPIKKYESALSSLENIFFGFPAFTDRRLAINLANAQDGSPPDYSLLTTYPCKL